MNKRDLKADLDWMMKAPSDHAKELEIAVHALERAIEAESLVRELADALGKAYEYIDAINSFVEEDLQVYGCNFNGEPVPFDSFIEDNGGREAAELVDIVLHKAKEVLGDGN